VNSTAAGSLSAIFSLITRRTLAFGLFNALVIAVFFPVLKSWLNFALQEHNYSHILLIPLVSGWLFYLKREEIFSNVYTSAASATVFLAIGSLLFGLGLGQDGQLHRNDHMALMGFSILLIWTGGFVLCFGTQALRKAVLPLCFLLFMIPLPKLVEGKVMVALQTASAEVSYSFFKLTGVPTFRDGFFFTLPGLTIEVTKECGGIRSNLVLLITAVVLGPLFLPTLTKKLTLILLTIPVAIFTNAVRIVSVSLMTVYVDERFLAASHDYGGGTVAFILALGLLMVVLWMLSRWKVTGSRR